MREDELQIQAAGAVLSGTLCLPSDESGFPCVLMLPGSGPIDRDENIAGQRLDIFNTVARSLASAGYASLRYDKRGCGRSTGEYFKAGYFDFVADAIACFDTLRRQNRFLRIYVLGHSEGSVTAMHSGSERPPVVREYESPDAAHRRCEGSTV